MEKEGLVDWDEGLVLERSNFNFVFITGLCEKAKSVKHDCVLLQWRVVFSVTNIVGKK
jgi:hypothetical protein